MNIVPFDAEKFYLGKLCFRQHDYCGTNKSLRRKSNYHCLECELAYTKDYNKQYREKNLEVIKAKNREYYRQNATRIIEYQKKYLLLNREKINARKRSYFKKQYAINPEISHAYIRARRARKRSNHAFKYTPEQLRHRYNEFGSSCAYCGCSLRLVPDHFIPIAKGGGDCLGNIVPSCISCNASKNDSDPADWYKSKPFYTDKKWRRILRILGKTEANYNQLPLL